MKVVLDSIDKVKSFSSICSNYESRIFLQSNRYMIDAKSIMGILSLDLTQPLNVIYEGMDEKDLIDDIKEYIV